MATLEEKARSMIMLCLYMTMSLTNKLLLKQHLFSLHMQEGQSLCEHLDQLNIILLELCNIDVEVEDEDAALFLLASMALSYENFVQSFIIGKDSVSLEEVRSSLHTRELRHKASGGGANIQVVGLVANGSKGHEKSGKKKNSKKSVSKGPKPDDVCNYCTDKGHWKFDCSSKKRPENETGTVAVAEDVGTNFEEDLALVVDEQTHHSDVWVLDSRVSYHICPRREWFTTNDQVDGGNISMDNSVVARRLGHAQLRYGHMTGFSFRGEGGVPYICKGDNVILKGVKWGTLYFLQGSTLSNSADVASFEVHKDNLTKLWNMRLGHMGERGMQILSKGDFLGGHKVTSLGFYEHYVFWEASSQQVT
ncbi:hypothetical protein OROMI_015279 [Orobanche minor]